MPIVDDVRIHSTRKATGAFLLHNHDPEEWDYSEASDQIREVLIHGHYLSQKDIEICLGFDLPSLGDGAPAEPVSALHDALIGGYGTDD